MCETLNKNIYLELNATAYNLKYNRHMWTQIIVCVIFLFMLQGRHYKCVELLKIVAKNSLVENI
jgi:hypothetical protein